MQYKSDVYTINDAAPPSYAEATGQIPMGNNSNISPSGQTCNRESSQMPSNNPPTASYPYPTTNFYIPTTTPYPIYPLNPQNQPPPTTLYSSNSIIAAEDASTQKCINIALACRKIWIVISCVTVACFMGFIFHRIFQLNNSHNM